MAAGKGFSEMCDSLAFTPWQYQQLFYVWRLWDNLRGERVCAYFRFNAIFKADDSGIADYKHVGSSQ